MAAEQQKANVCTTFVFPDSQKVKVIFKPCKTLRPGLSRLLQQDVVQSFCRWSYSAPANNALPRPPPLVIAHALAGDRGTDVRMCADPDDSSSVAAIDAMHKTYLEKQEFIIVRCKDLDQELVLVPVKVKTGKDTTSAAYWGYMVPASLLHLAAIVLHFSRLLVVFDLDETLLMAHTTDSLQQRIRRVNASREAKAAELLSLDSCPNISPEALDAQAQQLGAEMALLESEHARLLRDHDMLEFYKRDPQCRVLVKGPGGQASIVEPKWEKVRDSSGQELARPVVRLEVDGRPLYITRINPEFKKTSVLIRPRPGWQALKDYLSGMEDAKQGQQRKQRWNVYICTTAEKEYALEAWRLLDQDASIFPHEELVPKRLVCVPHPQQKDLLNVLRWEDIRVNQLNGSSEPPVMLTDEMRAAKSELLTAPMSVIVDDRADVWDEASRQALLQVMPFHPHKEAAALDMGPASSPEVDYKAATDSENELARVVSTLRKIRSDFYFELDTNIKPEAMKLANEGLFEGLQANALEIFPPMKPMQQHLASSPFERPAALGLTEKEDRASDLRLLANDSTMMTVGAPAGAPGQAAAAAAGGGRGVPISDPRKRRAAAAPAAAVTMPAPAEQQQQQEQPAAGFDFGASIEGLLQSLQGATAQQQQQQPPPAAAGDIPEQRAAKKPRISSPADAIDPTAAAAAAAATTPGLNNSFGVFSDHHHQQQQQQSIVPPGRPVAPAVVHSTSVSSLMHQPAGVLNPPMAPSFVVSIIKKAAAAAAAAPDGAAGAESGNDIAVYNDVIPAALREVATPQELLSVLAALSVQVKFSTNLNTAATPDMLKHVLGAEQFAVMKRAAPILSGHPDVAAFLQPILEHRGPSTGPFLATTASGGMEPSAGATQQQQQQQGEGPLLLDMRSTDVTDYRSLGGNPSAAAAVAPQQQQQQQQQQQPLIGAGRPSSDQVPLPSHQQLQNQPPPPPPRRHHHQQQQQLQQGVKPDQEDAAAAGRANMQQQQQQTGTSDVSQSYDAPSAASTLPTPDELRAIGHDADSFSYSYEAMRAASQHAPFYKLLQQHHVKNSPSLLADLHRERKGPRAEFLLFQGDARPGMVRDMADPNFTCIIQYWGKVWGYGYAPTKKGAKLRAAEVAAPNMYVSGIHFDRLPRYEGPKPTPSNACSGAGGGGGAAAGGASMGAAAGSGGFLSQQQQQQQSWQQQAISGVSAEKHLRIQYGERFKVKLANAVQGSMSMTAVLHETPDPNSRVLAEATGTAPNAEHAVEAAAAALLGRLGPAGQPPGQLALPAQQQQQQQQQQVHVAAPPWRVAAPGSSAVHAQMPQLQQQQQQQQQGFGMLQPQQQQPAGHAPMLLLSGPHPPLQPTWPAPPHSNNSSNNSTWLPGGSLQGTNSAGFNAAGPFAPQQQQQRQQYVPGAPHLQQQQQFGGVPPQPGGAGGGGYAMHPGPLVGTPAAAAAAAAAASIPGGQQLLPLTSGPTGLPVGQFGLQHSQQGGVMGVGAAGQGGFGGQQQQAGGRMQGHMQNR